MVQANSFPMVDTASPEIRKEPAVLVVNTRARRGAELLTQAYYNLQNFGVNLIHTYELREAEHLSQVVPQWVKEGVKSVIIGGGDGTISNCVDYLVNHNLALGVLPLGTANDFANTFNIPVELQEACRVIAAGHTVPTDLGIANGNYYLNVASIGFGAAVAASVSNDNKRTLGPLAYSLSAAQVALTQRPFQARIIFSNQTVEIQSYSYCCCQRALLWRRQSCDPTARIDDNELIVVVFEPMNASELWYVANHLRDGQYVRSPRVRVFRRVRSVRVEIVGDKQHRLNLDGEITGHTPTDFGIAHDALCVFAPANRL